MTILFEDVQTRPVVCGGWKFGIFSYDCDKIEYEWSTKPEPPFTERIWLGGRCTECRRAKIKAMEDSGYFNKRSTILKQYGEKYHG